jgi:hypothetical protein
MSRRNYDRHETRRCRQFPQIRQFPASPEHSRNRFRQFLPNQSQTKTTAQHHREGEAPAEPDVSVQFSVFSDRKIPSGGRQHQHTKRSNFRVFPRHSAAIVSRRAAKPSKAQGSCRAVNPSGGRGSRRAARSHLGRARLPPSRTSVFSFQCSVIAKSPREGDNTNTQNAQISALFRVIPRPSFPAEPPNPRRRKAPAEPCDPGARLSGSFALPRGRQTNTRLTRSFALPTEEKTDAGNPRFGIVSVLRGPLFVYTCGNATCNRAQDFELIKKKRAGLNRLAS